MKPELEEWTDPVTGVVHRAPAEYMKLLELIPVGRSHAVLAVDFLRRHGYSGSDSQQRHLRQVAMIARLKGMPIITLRSTKGGYFRAPALWDPDVTEYMRVQTSIALSMLRGVQALSDARGGSAAAIIRRPPDQSQQPDLFL